MDRVPFIIYQFTLDVFRTAENKAGTNNFIGRTLTSSIHLWFSHQRHLVLFQNILRESLLL